MDIRLHFGGYFFGSREMVKNNFTLVVLGIVFVSVLPAGVELYRSSRKVHYKVICLSPSKPGSIAK